MTDSINSLNISLQNEHLLFNRYLDQELLTQTDHLLSQAKLEFLVTQPCDQTRIELIGKANWQLGNREAAKTPWFD